jgi:hypothetical protein
MQHQQLQQQHPKVDVLVVAADVCNKAAMERAVKEHNSRSVLPAPPGGPWTLMA